MVTRCFSPPPWTLLAQLSHTEICEEYAAQMKELEEIMAKGPASMNVSLEQLAKQVM